MPIPNGDLRFGAFIAPFHAVDENPTLALERDFELVQLMDRLGYDEAWFGEHHSAGVELISSPELFIATAAERTRRIRLGTGVVSLPYHNPLMLAERMNQLDHVTRGRTIFGMGPGSLPTDATMMGIPYTSVRSRMDEALSVIVPLLKGERVTKKTDWFELCDAQLLLNSYSRPSIEMAVTNAVSPQGARWAGAYGLGMIGIAATSAAGFNALAANWAIAEELATDHGTSVSRAKWRLAGPMHVAETREKARQDVRFGLEKWLDYFLNVIATPLPLAAAGGDPVDALVDAGMAVIGTPEDAIAQIRRLEVQSGGFGCYLVVDTNWADWQAKQRSYELIARYVMPVFQDSNVNRVTSNISAAQNRPEFVEQSQAGTKAAFQRHLADKGDAHVDQAYIEAAGLKAPGVA